MTHPSLTVRAELVRAAMHFVPKSADARLLPDRAGIRFEPTLNGVLIVAMDDDAMLVLRDPGGECDRACTVKIATPFFDSARRAQREAKIEAGSEDLIISNGQSLLSGVSMPAAEVELQYPDWRSLVPSRVTRAAPAIDPSDDERIAIVAGILERIDDSLRIGVQYASPPEGRVVVARFGDAIDAFALVSPLPESIAAMPWHRPSWTSLSFQSEGARAA